MLTEMMMPHLVTLTEEVNGYVKGAAGILLMKLSCADREECVVRMVENGWAMYIDSACIREDI